MKIKIVSLIMLLVLSLTLVFVSCGGDDETSKPPKKPETAEELWERAKDEMDALDSFKSVAIADIKMYVSEKLVTGKIDGTIIVSDHENSPYYYEEIVNELKCDELDINTKTTAIEAYRNGIRFIKYDDGKTQNKICAEFDFEKFKEYIDKKSGESELDPTECVDLDFKENEDGTWTLTAGGFPKRAIDGFVAGRFDFLDTEIDDIELTLTMNKDFLVTKEEFSFVFENKGELTPSVSYVCDYSEFNSAKRVTETIDPDKYIKLDSESFALIDSLEAQIEEHQESENGALKLTAAQEVGIVGGAKNTSTEVDQVTYGVENGGYFYKILADVNGTDLEMVYKNGVVTTTPSGFIPSQSITDKEAKQNIADLINSAQFLKPFVTAVAKNNNGTYTITQKVVDGEKYETMIESIAQGRTHRYDGATQEITLTLDGDKITQIKSVISIKGSVRISSSDIRYIRITIGSIVEFLDPNAGGANGTTSGDTAIA